MLFYGVPTATDPVNPRSNPPPRSPERPEGFQDGPRSPNALERGRRSRSDITPPVDDWGPGPSQSMRPPGGDKVIRE